MPVLQLLGNNAVLMHCRFKYKYLLYADGPLGLSLGWRVGGGGGEQPAPFCTHADKIAVIR